MNFDFSFTPSRGPDRSRARTHAEEAVAIGERGSYISPSKRPVSIADAVKRAVSGTRDYRPAEEVRAPPSEARLAHATAIRVVNGTTLDAAHAMAKRGVCPFVLNFASAKHPGGGFLRGARAQEESLARGSALYECIRRSEMYEAHRVNPDAIYTDWMIYSPGVPVFRDDDTGKLLDEPYLANFLTAAAPNAGVALERDPGRLDEVNDAMRSRITRTLAIAAASSQTHLVLGAWGCGVFKNSPTLVAEAYQRDLAGAFAGVFEEVVFAVLDRSEDRHFVRPFAERFA